MVDQKGLMMEKQLVTISEAAQLTGMSSSWWRHAVAGRKPMPPIRVIRVGAAVRLHLGDLLTWINGGIYSARSTHRRPGRPTKAAQVAIARAKTHLEGEEGGK